MITCFVSSDEWTEEVEKEQDCWVMVVGCEEGWMEANRDATGFTNQWLSQT